MSKKRSCDNNKAIKMVRNALPKLKKDFSDIGSIDLVFKKGRRTGSHCYELVLESMMGVKKITVVKSKKSRNSNFLLLPPLLWLLIRQSIFTKKKFSRL